MGCTRSAETISRPHSRFQPCHHFLSLHLLPCHFSLTTPPTSHFLSTKGTELSHPPCLSLFPRTLPVLLLLVSALLPRRLSFHSHSSSAHLRPSRERPLLLDVFAAHRAGLLSRLHKGRRFVMRKRKKSQPSGGDRCVAAGRIPSLHAQHFAMT